MTHTAGHAPAPARPAPQPASAARAGDALPDEAHGALRPRGSAAGPLLTCGDAATLRHGARGAYTADSHGTRCAQAPEPGRARAQPRARAL
eukprot:12484358-Alexandrium_andersonii.AAC.1